MLIPAVVAERPIFFKISCITQCMGTVRYSKIPMYMNMKKISSIHCLPGDV